LNTNPVLRALERARLDAQLAEWETREAELKTAIARRLGDGPQVEESGDTSRAVARFRTWCELNGVRYFPAQPATLAHFVLEHAPDGIEQLAETIAAVSRSHFVRGLPNPVATWMVAAAMEHAGDTAPPRSWPKSLKAQFSSLPQTLKHYIAVHDAQREKVLRRAQNEAARARRALAHAQPRAQPDISTTGGRDAESDT
jgi:hypothetical protein